LDDTARLLALAPASTAEALDRAAAEAGFGVVHVTDLSKLLGRVREGAWAATLLSLSAESVDEAVAKRVAGESSAGALLLSAPGVSLPVALLSQRAGAVALLREPIGVDELARRLLEIADEGTDVPLPTAPDGQEGPLLIGESAAMAEVFETVARVAGSSTTVLLTGESGTGKEVVARAFHAASARAGGPFVPVNCAAIPEQLLESELFGHEKGAFTGATGRRRGRFERADGGTLFLDEIGDMSLVLQAKLLRVLEEGTVEPLGSEAPTTVDVRAVAATNRDLSEAIASGAFREDLYYRLAVVELAIPPLRERGEDIRRLALHFASHFAGRHDRAIRGVTARALESLESYSWPGNVRELRNVMDRAVMLSRSDVIKSSSLRLGPAAPNTGPRGTLPTEGYRTDVSLAEVEADHIARVLRSVQGHLINAADILGIHRNTLSRKVREYGIAIPGRSES
jgi:two-component system response regulator HydG